MGKLADKLKSKLKGVFTKEGREDKRWKERGSGHALGTRAEAEADAARRASERRAQADARAVSAEAERAAALDRHRREQARRDAVAGAGGRPANGALAAAEARAAGKQPASARYKSLQAQAAPALQRTQAQEQQERQQAQAQAQQQQQQQRDALGEPPASLVSFIVSGGDGASVQTLHKVFANILAHPSEAKYRRLRLTNPKVNELVVEVDGGLETLTVEAGFDVTFEPDPGGDGEQGVATLAEGADLAPLEVLCRHMEAAQPALPRAAPAPRKSALEALSGGVGPRHARVYRPPLDGSMRVPELPDGFFDLTVAEARAAAAGAASRREEASQLTTRAYKERLARERAGGGAVGGSSGRPPTTHALVRVRLPSGMLLQAVFGAKEPASSVRSFVADALLDPTTEFELFMQPGRTTLPESKTVHEAGLCPAALLNMNVVRGGAELNAELGAVAEQMP